MKTTRTISTLALLLSSVLSAHNTDTAIAQGHDYTYDMNFTTLFLKPHSNFMYAAQATPLPVPSPNWNLYGIAPHYNFAFDLGAQITLHKKNSVLKGDWEHFLSSAQSAQNISLSTNMVGPLTEIGPDASVYQKAAGFAQYQRDKMNIVYGQTVQVGQDLMMNLCAGISFNRLHQTLTQTFTSNDTTTYFRQIVTENTFSGVGPELALDLTYRIHKGLNFVSHSQADFATGTTKNHIDFYSYSPLNGAGNSFFDYQITKNPNAQSTTVDGQLIVVPILTQKIGLNYDLHFRKHCSFQMEIGYFTQFYLDVFYTALFATDVPSANTEQAAVGVYAQSFQEKMSNFALTGPYFRMEIAF